jgi:hypothetical protein
MRGEIGEMRDLRVTYSCLIQVLVLLLLWCSAAAHTHLSVCMQADERELRPALNSTWFIIGELQKARCYC